MYGDLAAKLIQDSRRTLALENLPLYLEDLVRATVREIRDLDRDARELQNSLADQASADNRSIFCSLFVQHLSMHRNKRCLIAYQRLRADRMVEMAWKEADWLEHDENLHSNEHDYLRKYSELLVDFKGPWTDIDLTGSMEPPRDLFIDVRVLKDAGEIQTEYGVFNLTKNSQFFVREADVHRLIQQGYLQKL